MKKKKRYILLGGLLALGLALAWGLHVSKLPHPLFDDDYSQIVLAANGEILRVFLNESEQWLLADCGQEIPAKLKAAVLCYEDKRFLKHRGIDFLAVARALYQNVKKRGRISGASTITMQVARLMEPKPRTLANKLKEMAQAVRIELEYSKEEILKLYLLHAPYGGNILGYRAASLRYFSQEPASLSWAQAATLAVLPNNPANVNPMRNRDQLQEKRDGLLLRLCQEGVIDQGTYELAILEPVPEGQSPFPIAAPHLAERLAAAYKQPVIETTIDAALQNQVQGLLASFMQELKPRGIKNGAVLLTETLSGEIKAYVASQDYFDDENLGKIDGIQMRRSTGSTLKPFLYALAMDEGIIVPQSVLEDLRTSYGGYTPFNADGEFHGMVRADEALIRSLNAPAVQLLNEVGVQAFFNFLKAAGLWGLRGTPKEHGLSLILGSAAGSLWELSRLYRGLGNLGSFADLVVVPGENKGAARILSPGSSFLVLEILREVARPQADFNWRQYQSSAPLAWKTGTSYGGSDAWSVGVSPQWTIAVWLGNFAGGEIKGLSGIDCAAPLLFQVFNSLEKSPNAGWFTRPEDDLREILVSARTGYRLRESGGQAKRAWASASAKPLRLSPYEHNVFMNKAETMQVCSLCWDRDDLKSVSKVIYPPPAQGDFLPPHNPNCPALAGQNPLHFIYPQQDSVIFIPRHTEEGYQKVKMEVAHIFRDEQLFWYLDHVYIGKTEGQHSLGVILEKGRHQLSVVDGAGNSNSIRFTSIRR